MKKTLILLTFLAISGAAVLNGCKKDNKETDVADADTQTAQDNALAEGTYNDVNDIANQAVQNGNSLSTYRLSHDEANLLSSCATVTIPSAGTIVVDFGSTPCYCNDLKYRKGIINITYTGMYNDSGTVITITFNNYYVGKTQANMYKVMGTKTVTNKGHNAAGHQWFDINVNGSLLNVSGQTMTWTSHRQREWISGDSTPSVWSDDQYMITGSASGTGFNGTSYSLTITQGLHIDLSCRWIRDGKFELTPSGKPTRYVDYGSGACDAIVTVTINNISYTFAL